MKKAASERLALEIKILSSFLSGASVKEISARHRVSQSKVRTIIKNYKLNKRKP